MATTPEFFTRPDNRGATLRASHVPATVNFFELQARARRRTWLLLVWMLLAVAGITLVINIAAYGVAVAGGFLVAPRGGGVGAALDAWLAHPWWIPVSAVTLLALLAGSLTRYITISKGGRAIADMIDARRVDLSTREPHDRRFINVVEEMAIASGMPRPALYVMEQEAGINAFVAGMRPTDAIMVVTRGALDHLDRDALQGVVGHEFSHILNGDMRLNLRLMAIVAGILLFGKVGAFMLRGGRGTGYGRRRRRFSVGSDARIMVAWYASGLTLLVVGYVGLFCGRLIKAAVSRQREFLADASSVQFTRNPEGLSGALWQIAESSTGARLASPYAEDMSHMCFGQSVPTPLFGSLLATHPPIERRLAAIDPQFRARRIAQRQRQKAEQARVAAGQPQPGTTPGVATGMAMPAALAGAAVMALDARTMTLSVGNPTPEHATQARALHSCLPAAVLDAAHQARGAEALVYALLLGEVNSERVAVAGALIAHQVDADCAEQARALHAALQAAGDAVRLPVLDLAVATLRDTDTRQRQRVVEVSDRLIRVDQHVSLFEFALLALLRHHLASVDAPADRVRFFSLAPVMGDVRRLLSLLARAGSEDEARARQAFLQATAGFSRGQLTLAQVEQCDPARMHEALERIALLSPLLKRPVLEACVDCVQHDGRVTLIESELLRAIAASLDCPLPPLLPGAAA